MRRSHTAVVERDVVWEGPFETEPYEAAWASEAVFFIRTLEAKGTAKARARVQVSPDGMHWVDEGTSIAVGTSGDEVTFGRVAQFGTFLRLRGEVPSGGSARVIVTLALKE